jgi:hypothetical protein
VVLYPLPAAGTAALVGQGLLVSFPGLDRAVQRGSGDFEGLTNLHNRALRIVKECLGNGSLPCCQGIWPTASFASGSGSSKPCLGSLPDQVSLKLRQRTEDMENQLAVTGRRSTTFGSGRCQLREYLVSKGR